MTATAAKPELKAIKGGLLKSVEIATQRENHDAWELADAVYNDVIAEIPPESLVATRDSRSGPKPDLQAAQEKIFDEHRKAGTELGRTYLTAMFDTVRVWPPDARLYEKASFVVHSELRGKDYPNRRDVIEKLAAKSETGRATWANVRRWKSERKPAQHKSFLQLAEEKIRRGVHEAGKPWNQVASDDRKAILNLLYAIAAEIEAGTFA